MITLPEKKSSDEQSDIARLEPLVKLLAGTVGLVTLLGVPAVLFQYAYYGIPVYFISTERALKAGVLPALFLILSGSFIYVLVRRARTQEREHIASMVEWALPPAILAFAIFSTAIFMTILNTFLFLSVKLMPRVLPYFDEFSIGGVFAIFGVSLLLTVTSTLFLYSTRRPISRILKTAINSLKKRLPSFLFESNERGRGELNLRAQYVMIFIVMLIVVSLYELTSRLTYGSSLSNLGIFALAVFLFTCLYATFSLQELDYPRDPVTPDKALRIAVRTMIPLYLGTVLLYSSVLYPSLSPYLGGGKITDITIWIENQALPKSDILPGLSDWNDEGSLVKIENLHLLEANKSYWILVQPGYSNKPWIAFPTSSIKAYSQPDE